VEPLRPLHIAVLVPDARDPYFRQKEWGYRDEAKRLGKVEVVYIDAGGYWNPRTQLAQAEELALAGVDAAIITPIDGKAIVEAVEKALKGGVALLADEHEIFSPKVKMRIMKKEAEIGELMGEALARALGGKGGIGMLKSAADRYHGEQRALAASQALGKYPDLKILASIWVRRSQSEGLGAARGLLEQYPKLRGIYCDAAPICAGVVKALKESGRLPGQLKVVARMHNYGILDLLEKGWVEATVVTENVAMARMSMRTLVEHLRGKWVLSYRTPENFLIKKGDLIFLKGLVGLWTPPRWMRGP
ncbi:MAG: sugar ABC transporter substrate-binding protein, partial [Nitrospinota bacterium]